MSLLLDALKKAADDKNKKTANAALDEVPGVSAKKHQENVDSHIIDEPTTTDPQIDSLELELDLDLQSASELIDSKNTTQKSLIDDDFPEVDETIISSTETINTALKNTDSIDESEIKDVDDSPIEIIDETSVDIPDVAVEVPDKPDKPILPEDDVAHAVAAESPAEVIPELTETPSATTTKPPTENAASIKIKNEEALSALINKSNQYSRREKLKKNIAIVILIVLILIGSGLYFYIEMQTSNQDFYIAQPDSKVNREKTTQNIKPVLTSSPSQALSAPQQNIVNNTNTTSQVKPVTKAPIVNRPRIKQPESKKIISIVRTKKQDPVHVLLHDAYTAFHNENYRKAESLYQKVTNREPLNRDALLGLAAIGVKEKRFEYARQKYQYLLKLNPRDSFAIAGLSSIENRIDPQLNESQLKFMLKQQPDSSHLYFALGSHYSSQNKWAEAQTAFFSAWSAENKNADYAYNLAISLDHLDKKKQALDFYQLSLKLKQASSGNFSSTDTEQRISALQENKP